MSQSSTELMMRKRWPKENWAPLTALLGVPLSKAPIVAHRGTSCFRDVPFGGAGSAPLRGRIEAFARVNAAPTLTRSANIPKTTPRALVGSQQAMLLVLREKPPRLHAHAG